MCEDRTTCRVSGVDAATDRISHTSIYITACKSEWIGKGGNLLETKSPQLSLYFANDCSGIESPGYPQTCDDEGLLYAQSNCMHTFYETPELLISDE